MLTFDDDLFWFKNLMKNLNNIQNIKGEIFSTKTCMYSTYQSGDMPLSLIAI